MSAVAHVPVAGDDGPVRQPHDEGRIVGAAVGVDQQAREAGEDRGGGEPRGQRLGEEGGTGIPRDVALELGRRQPERGEFRGHVVGSMVAEDEEGRGADPRLPEYPNRFKMFALHADGSLSCML